LNARDALEIDIPSWSARLRSAIKGGCTWRRNRLWSGADLAAETGSDESEKPESWTAAPGTARSIGQGKELIIGVRSNGPPRSFEPKLAREPHACILDCIAASVT